MNKNLIFKLVCVFLIFATVSCAKEATMESGKDWKVIDETSRVPVIEKVMTIDKVWAGHPVSFFLLTEGDRQFVAYYNADRKMIVASRNIDEEKWTYFHPVATLEGTSTNLGWDSHNSIKMALDAEGFLHLSGNMHVTRLTYFRSEKPYDITTLKQVDSMVGTEEDRATYPVFMAGAGDDFIFHYRDGYSGNGNEIYNVYDLKTKKWSRLLDKPLTDGQGKMNAYILGPWKSPNGWFHASWVWRDPGACELNHDLSYAKSNDLRTWYDAAGNKVELPLTLDNKSVIVDPIPIEQGIINGSGRIGFDGKGRAVISYHKFDEEGNTQAYLTRFEDGKWNTKQITDWNYRWFFQGPGSIAYEIWLGEVKLRQDGYMEIGWKNKKHGRGTWLINDDLQICGEVLKGREMPSSYGQVESDFKGMRVRSANDSGDSGDKDVKYFLRWEVLGPNRDLPRTGPLPEPSELTLYKIRYEQENK